MRQQQMTKLRLGGVPEHFNLPIHLAIESQAFENAGVSVEWTTYTGGTGHMTEALRNNEVDACVLLTEGIIKDIIGGNPAQIISGYVNTPLIWGVHTGIDNKLQHHSEIYSEQYAISRFGSGSHLMAIVDATLQDQVIAKDQFSVIKNLNGALESLATQATDVFYWEKYTTKPYVDAGHLRRIGEFVTPWPCFVIAARNEVIERDPDSVIRMLRTIHNSCDHFMGSSENIALVADRYGQKLSDVERWYHSTEWAIHGWVSDKMLRSVVHNLQVSEIIPQSKTIPSLVWMRE